MKTKTQVPWFQEQGVLRTASFLKGDLGYVHKIEDAEFIVRAVNSHEALINALKIAQATIGRYAELGHFNTHSSTFDVIDEALSQAEGKGE